MASLIQRILNKAKVLDYLLPLIIYSYFFLVVIHLLIVFYLISQDVANDKLLIYSGVIFTTLSIGILLVIVGIKLYLMTNDNLTKALKNEFSQIESLGYIQSQVRFTLPPPSMRSWAASPDLLSIIIKNVHLYQPKHIVELGSGVSTLYVSKLIDTNKLNTTITSLDHSDDYAQVTAQNLKNEQLDHVAVVKYCPLRNYVINGTNWAWYDVEAVKKEMVPIDILVVDGPIGASNKKMRYPAIPLLYDKLAPNALIILDDYIREDEKSLVQDWLKEYPSLRLLHEYDTEKGTAVLQKTLEVV